MNYCIYRCAGKDFVNSCLLSLGSLSKGLNITTSFSSSTSPLGTWKFLQHWRSLASHQGTCGKSLLAWNDFSGIAKRVNSKSIIPKLTYVLFINARLEPFQSLFGRSFGDLLQASLLQTQNNNTAPYFHCPSARSRQARVAARRRYIFPECPVAYFL